MVSNQDYYFGFTTVCTIPVVVYVLLSMIKAYNCIVKKSIHYSLEQNSLNYSQQTNDQDPIQLTEMLDEDPIN
jgi:hypothetical protein